MITHFNTRQAAIGGETYVGRQTKGGSRRSKKALEEASLRGLTIVTCEYFTILCHSTDQHAFWHYPIPQDFTFPILENSLDAFNSILMIDQVTNQMMADKQKIRRSWKSIDRYQCIDTLCRSAQQFGYTAFSTRHNIYFIKSDVASTLIIKKHGVGQSQLSAATESRSPNRHRPITTNLHASEVDPLRNNIPTDQRCIQGHPCTVRL
jgi:hypothetical protein